jgi:hypothetical protein
MIKGDARSSEQPGLAAVHTLFMREHNRLAEGLAKLNPHWDDEILYQQARRILSGVTQHIVYREFLPRLLGWDAVHTYGLTLQNDGYFTGKYRDQWVTCMEIIIIILFKKHNIYVIFCLYFLRFLVAI